MKLLLCAFACLASVSLAHAALDPAAFAAAAELYTQRKPLEAQKAFEALAVADPANADVQFYLGRLALQQNGDAALAVGYLEKAVALRPGESRFHQRLGDAYGQSAIKAGLFSKMSWAKKCHAAYAKAVELDPTNLDAQVSLVEYFRQAPSMVGGGMDKAYAQAEQIKKLDPVRARTVFAGLYASEKKFPEAFALYEEELETNPNNYAALYQIGRLAALSGERVDAGIEALKKCLTQTPQEGQPSLSGAHWRLGQLFEKKGDKAAARASYEAALQLEPNFAQASDALKKL